MLGKMREGKQAGGGRKKPRRKPAGGPGGVLTTFYGGLDVLTDALGKSFKGKLLLNAPVREVRRTGAAGADGKFIVSAAGVEAPSRRIYLLPPRPLMPRKIFFRALTRDSRRRCRR